MMVSGRNKHSIAMVWQEEEVYCSGAAARGAPTWHRLAIKAALAPKTANPVCVSNPMTDSGTANATESTIETRGPGTAFRP